MGLLDLLGWRLSARLLAAGVGCFALGACAVAVASERDDLWRVVRACAADARLTTLAFPCLAVDLEGGVERGHILLRPPWANDLILSPTRRSIGIEDPFLQSPEAPNYFAQAWRARAMIKTTNGRPPSREQVVLLVNSAGVRAQDQLHIHIACLFPHVRRVLADAAPLLPLDAWRPVGLVKPHEMLWGMRVRSADLEGVNPFRLVHRAFDGAVRNPADEMIMVVGARVDDQDEFLILAAYGHAPRPWLTVGTDDFVDLRCKGEGVAGG